MLSRGHCNASTPVTSQWGYLATKFGSFLWTGEAIKSGSSVLKSLNCCLGHWKQLWFQWIIPLAYFLPAYRVCQAVFWGPISPGGLYCYPCTIWNIFLARCWKGRFCPPTVWLGNKKNDCPLKGTLFFPSLLRLLTVLIAALTSLTFMCKVHFPSKILGQFC